jgi:Secretion system C-terminal sorting domain
MDRDFVHCNLLLLLPQDFSIDNTACSRSEAQHEGDSERVVVIIERSSLKVRGYLSSNHSNKDKVNCIDYSSDRSCESTQDDPCDSNDNLEGCYALFFENDQSGGNFHYYDGEHPVIYSSAGSHAMYELECRAKNDNTTTSNECKPDVDFVIAFVPGLWTNGSSSNFVNQYTKSNWVNDTVFPFEVITYELFDVFSTNIGWGLWEHKNDEENLFTTPDMAFVNNQQPYEIIPSAYGFYEDYSNQRLKCNTHCGDGGGAIASAPWNGDLGLNILPYLNNNFSEFRCCPNDTNCQLISAFKECEYVHNEYLCDGYRIKLTDVYQDGADVVATFKFLSNNMLYNGFVNWAITPQNGGWPLSEWVASGQGTSIYIVTFKDATFDPNGLLSNYSITASAYPLECGTVADTYNVPISTNGLVITTGDCYEIIIKYDPLSHIEGNVYTWDFFGYDDLAVSSEGNKKNTFNTPSVITKYNNLNNQSSIELPRILPYRVKVENEISPIAQPFQEWYGYILIPHCLSGNAIIVYPNPAVADIIHIELSGEILKEINPEESSAILLNKTRKKNLLILNNMLQLVKESPIHSFRETIDISSLGNGLYYLYTTTKGGEILFQKFIIAR